MVEFSLEITKPALYDYNPEFLYTVYILKDGKRASINIRSSDSKAMIRDTVAVNDVVFSNDEMEQMISFIKTNDLFINESIKSAKLIHEFNEEKSKEKFHFININFVGFTFSRGNVIVQYEFDGDMKRTDVSCKSVQNNDISSVFWSVVRSSGLIPVHSSTVFSKETYESFSEVFNEIKNHKRFHFHLIMSYNGLVDNTYMNRIYNIVRVTE